MIHRAGPGDQLASGARSATFSVAPNMKFNEGQMMDDLTKISETAFCERYMITPMEYDRLKVVSKLGDDQKVNDFTITMRERADAYNRELASDDRQETSLSRDCFIKPRPGSVIVDRDVPLKTKGTILMPPKAQRQRELLPTTGHVIVIGTNVEAEYGELLLGKRVLFQQMSGQVICFKGYPTWVQLAASEIMGIVEREDADVVEEKLEAMV